jgi:predicted Zn-dependent peptidase
LSRLISNNFLPDRQLSQAEWLQRLDAVTKADVVRIAKILNLQALYFMEGESLEIKKYPQVGETLYKEILDNGLLVYYLPKPEFNKTYGLFTTNFGSLDTQFIPRGSSDMQTFPEGIAHFWSINYLRKRWRCHELFGALGANSNAFTSFTRTSYLFSTMENVEPNVELLLDFVQEPYFTQPSVEKEQGIITQEIQMYQDDADFRLFLVFYKIFILSHL